MPACLFPTCVGMNRLNAHPSQPFIAVPHVRGDEPVKDWPEHIFVPCSPRAWG